MNISENYLTGRKTFPVCRIFPALLMASLTYMYLQGNIHCFVLFVISLWLYRTCAVLVARL